MEHTLLCWCKHRTTCFASNEKEPKFITRQRSVKKEIWTNVFFLSHNLIFSWSFLISCLLFHIWKNKLTHRGLYKISLFRVLQTLNWLPLQNSCLTTSSIECRYWFVLLVCFLQSDSFRISRKYFINYFNQFVIVDVDGLYWSNDFVVDVIWCFVDDLMILGVRPILCFQRHYCWMVEANNFALCIFCLFLCTYIEL